MKRTVPRTVRSFLSPSLPVPYPFSQIQPVSFPYLTYTRQNGGGTNKQAIKFCFPYSIFRTAGATCAKLLFSFPYLTYKLSPSLRTKQWNTHSGYARNYTAAGSPRAAAAPPPPPPVLQITTALQTGGE